MLGHLYNPCSMFSSSRKVRWHTHTLTGRARAKPVAGMMKKIARSVGRRRRDIVMIEKKKKKRDVKIMYHYWLLCSLSKRVRVLVVCEGMVLLMIGT